MIVYDRLWKTMEKKGISQYSLIHDYNINESQLDRFRKNSVIKTVRSTVYAKSWIVTWKIFANM